MDSTILTLLSLTTASLVVHSHGFHPGFAYLENLHRNNVPHSNIDQNSLISPPDSEQESARVLDLSFPFQNQNIEQAEVQESPNDLAKREKILNSQKMKEEYENKESEVLDGGLTDQDIASVFEEALRHLEARLKRYTKRNWGKILVHTRFAPFGTKLVPSRKLENGGATLLRYGRGAQ